MTFSLNTPILPGEYKFQQPPQPTFDRTFALLSAISLFVFAVAAVASIVALSTLPSWSLAPFEFVALGSVGGLIYELVLIARGKPYQLNGSPPGRFIQKLRAINLAFVFGSTNWVYGMIALGPAHGNWWIVVVGVILGALVVVVSLDGPPVAGGLLILLGLIGQLSVIWLCPTMIDNSSVRILLTLQSLVLHGTILVGAETPQRSTIFHVLGTISVIILYLAYRAVLNASPGLLHASTFPKYYLLGAIVVGVFTAFRLLPKTKNTLRAYLADAIWPLFYLVIAGSESVSPKPARLSVLYKLVPPQRLTLYPYHMAHPRNLSHPLSIPCLDEHLSSKVTAFGGLLALVRGVFGVVSVLNKFFPFANIRIPLDQKPRLAPWSDGSDYWPWWLMQRIRVPRLGMFSIQAGVRGPGFQSTPDKAIETYKTGQLLAYLVERGIGGSFLRPGNIDGRDVMVLDLSFLEPYETKADYEPYGGTAYFVIDQVNLCLHLISVRAPRTTAVLAVNPQDASFRHAEGLIIASLYYYVVSGKHLVEIHMGLNLVEIAMMNAFDAVHRWDHPIRVLLYPHFFAHELAEELTTENLVEDGGVFSQIFATTNSSLINHLNDRFSEYELGKDEDFEGREAVLLHCHDNKPLEEILPCSSLLWEKEYAAIWQEYADAAVRAVYVSDADVQRDGHVQQFFAELSATFLRPLPERYARFQTKAGLSRFISDTMHHLIIRHEVYGTSGVRLALDPRINNVQIPCDGGPSALDEWRSLACIAMATSRVRYTKLSVDFSEVFLDIPDEKIRKQIMEAYGVLKSRLIELEKRFLSDGLDNYNTLRLLPSELDIGAGY